MSIDIIFCYCVLVVICFVIIFLPCYKIVKRYKTIRALQGEERCEASRRFTSKLIFFGGLIGAIIWFIIGLCNHKDVKIAYALNKFALSDFASTVVAYGIWVTTSITIVFLSGVLSWIAKKKGTDALMTALSFIRIAGFISILFYVSFNIGGCIASEEKRSQNSYNKSYNDW